MTVIGARIRRRLKAARLSQSTAIPVAMSADAFPQNQATSFVEAVSNGLSATPKWLSPKWLYDPLGAKLFEAITELPEYYPTRTEIALFEAVMPKAVAGLGQDVAVIELGSGSSTKTPLLLQALDRPSFYIPIDIAEPALLAGAKAIRERFPALNVAPLVADFTATWHLPVAATAAKGRKLCFFPGSTIGNLDRGAAVALLAHARAALGQDPVMLVGVDTPKSQAVVIPAYDDALGVTAAFNKNILVRLNRELAGNANLAGFAHLARWNATESRVEMHLFSLRDQTITCSAGRFTFEAGETIHTESSHKWAPESFRSMAEAAGWRVTGVWLAPQEAFALHRLEA
ncbi:MAG: L-histidine N(alpha)-methyltransferase [Caulobacterales bacterium]|jgi:dimethylhistidine N-methyltransferase